MFFGGIKCHCDVSLDALFVLFLPIQCMSTDISFAGQYFFFLLFSLLPKKYRLILFVLDISTLVFILLILVFILDPFIKFLFIFNLTLNSNLSYLIFLI